MAVILGRRWSVAPSKKLEISERRKKVAELYKQRYRHYEIAEMLNVDRSTISRDLQAIRNLWLESMLDNIHIAKLRELADLDEMERQCIERLDRLEKQPHQGSRWMEERRKIKERRAKLLGLDAEKKFRIDASVTVGTKEQRDAAVRAANKKYGENIDLIKPQKTIEYIENNSLEDMEIVGRYENKTFVAPVESDD